ncbi:hypothetical protein D3C80_1952040 [compost metagenome]
MRILAITERQHGIAEAVQGPRLAQHLALESAGAVRRLAVTEGADHEQRAARLA